MRLSRWVLFTLFSVLLPGSAFAVGGLAISGGAGGVTVSGQTTILGAVGDAFSVSTSSGTHSFTGLDIDNPTGDGIALTNNTGSITATGVDLDGITNRPVDVNQGTAAISLTLSDTVTNSNDRTVSVTNLTGGSCSISGSLLDIDGGGGIHVLSNSGNADIDIDSNLDVDTPGATAITATSNSGGANIDFGGASKALTTSTAVAANLTTNTGATIGFSGGGLDIDTTSGTGFSATGGGTVNVTGVNNTIDTTTGRPVDIQNTNAGGSGITFARALSSGGGQIANIITSTGTKTLGRVSTSSGATTALNLNGAGTVNIGDAALASSLTTTTAPAITINNSTLGFSGLGVGLNTTGGGAGMGVTGGTVAITGNGMVIDTDDATDGPGFVATSGGTVTVQGTAHTVTSGGQTAVNIANTTIGANGFTLQSLSSNGAGSGIVLNNTGATGLTVTGTDGGDAGSEPDAGTGGTIQNTTSHGVSLTNANNVSLGGMNVSGTGGHGIHMSGGSNLTVIGTQVTNAGNADDEHGLNVLNTGGTLALNRATFDGAAEDLVRIESTGSVTLNVNNQSQFSFPMSIGANAGNGFELAPSGSGSINASIVDSFFDNIKGDSVNLGALTAGANGAQSLTFSSNDIDVTLAGRASGIAVSGQEMTTTNLTIHNNNFSGAGGNGVINLDTNDNATTTGNITNNIISSPPGIGINVAVDESGVSRIRLDSNNITNSGGDGILTVNFGGTGVSTKDMIITNNTVNGNGLDNVQSFLGGIVFVGFEDNNRIVMRGNTVTGTVPDTDGRTDYWVEEVGGTTTFEEVPNTASTTLDAAYLRSINVDPDGGGGGQASVTIFGVIDLSNGTPIPLP